MTVSCSAPFVAYAKCSVIYDGRAHSVLERGNYLICWKQDGSLLIHGSMLCAPKNYMGSGTTMQCDESQWTFVHKKEKIVVEVDDVMWRHVINDWSDHPVKMTKTERELRQKLVRNVSEYLPVSPAAVYEEFQTDLGPVDVMVVAEDDSVHVIEVKRGRASVNACIQLEKYLSVLKDATGYIAAPAISPKALKWLNDHGGHYIFIDFDQPGCDQPGLDAPTL